MNEILTPMHERWKEFMELMNGEQGCNFRKNDKGNHNWTCLGGTDKSLARSILIRFFPEIDLETTLIYFHKHGGHCDCEIVFNVEDSVS